MLALKINDVKGFMNRLLIGETFDQFPMAEASVTTFNTFSIDGLINKEFFDTDIEKLQQSVARNKGYTLDEHSLSLYARCNKIKCEGKKNKDDKNKA